MENIVAIDLFCGAGGLTKGLAQAGIKVLLGVDIDPACAFPFSHNNDAIFLNASVAQLSASDLPEIGANSFSLLAGCAPCQTFSTYNQKATSDDERWWLLNEFSRIIVESNPDFVTMENVPGLMKEDVFDSFCNVLSRNNYEIEKSIIDCSEYGLPQRRQRLVLLASRYGRPRLLTPREFFPKETDTTVGAAIGGLPPLRAGEMNNADPLHQAARLSDLNLKRIRHSKPGGTWRDWPAHLISNCHKKGMGATYASVYGRMKEDAPSPTITTQFYGYGSGRFGHPTQDRAISLREGAILQGFPENYKFSPDDAEIKRKTIGRLIGNAVPVTLGRLIGKSFAKHIREIS